MSGMADLLRQLIEGNRATRYQPSPVIAQGNSDSEDDPAHPPSKRRRADDEISLSASDQDIRDLVDPEGPEPQERETRDDTPKNIRRSTS